MKKTFYILAAFAACFAISCNKEITTEEPINEGETPEVEMQTITIKATIDDIVTKSYYAGGTTFNWNAGDEISVYCSDGSFYTFSADGTGTSTTFTGAIPAGKSLGAYAFFPADAGHTDGHFSLPRYKDLTSHNSADIPMVGTKGVGDIYSFVHCAGAALLTVTNIPSNVTSATITVESAHASNPAHCIKLSGSFYLNGIDTSAPYWSGDYAADDAQKQFSRKVPVTDHTAQVYVICPGGYTNNCPNKLTVVGHTSSEDVPLITEKAMKKLGQVDRAHVLPLTPLILDNLSRIDWSSVTTGVSSDGNYKELKVTYDKYYIYFHTIRNRNDELWGSSGYVYYMLDTDNNTATGGSDPNNGSDTGYESIFYFSPYAGTSSDPAFKTTVSTTVSYPVGSPTFTPGFQGSFDANTITMNFSVLRSDALVNKNDNIRIESYGNKSLSKATIPSLVIAN